MTKMSNTLGETRRYRWTKQTTLLNFSSAIYMFPSSVLGIGGIEYFCYVLWAHGDLFDRVFAVALACMVSPILLMFLILLTLPIGRLLFSYLRVGPDGIAYRNWPTYGVRCSWEDVERIGDYSSLGLIPYKVLYLSRGDLIGLPIMLSFRRLIKLKADLFVPLTGFEGWPDGELALDVKRYKPSLFTDSENEPNSIS